MTSGKVIPFNPLDKHNLGESVAMAMLRQPVVSMKDIPTFSGAGVYAIYYVGDFPCYEPVSRRNESDSFEMPIYVGKAVPAGARKGGELNASPGKVLFKRLSEHCKSIEQVRNLRIEDFFCRYLVVDDIWIPLGESLLIARFSPVWNKLVDGFGNHNPGKGRHAGLRPRWDVLHPGRSWADSCKERPESAEEICREVRVYLDAR